jgi:hypothetical protein
MQHLAALLLWEMGGEVEFSENVLREFDFRNAQISMSKDVNGTVRVRLRGIPFPPPQQDDLPVRAEAERLDQLRALGPGFA